MDPSTSLEDPIIKIEPEEMDSHTGERVMYTYILLTFQISTSYTLCSALNSPYIVLVLSFITLMIIY
jgi:hypothetical protein